MQRLYCLNISLRKLNMPFSDDYFQFFFTLRTSKIQAVDNQFRRNLSALRITHLMELFRVDTRNNKI